MGYCKHSLRQHMQSTLHSAGYIINIRKCCYKCNDLILHMIVILDMIQDCGSENSNTCVLHTANIFFITVFLNYGVI